MAEDFSTLTHVSSGLTNDLLTRSLTDWFGEPMTFTHWEYVGDTGKGDSYMSEVIRIKIYGLTQQNISKYVQTILKTIPKSSSRRLTFRCDEFFKNEILFYKDVLPELLKLQASKNLKEPFDNYAKVLLSYSDGLNDAICLEDASLENFGSAVRQEGIDLEHCKISLKTFAKFHALSFAMKDQKPVEFERISKSITEVYYHERNWPWYERFWKNLSGIAIDAVEKEYPNSIYEKKIKEFASPKLYPKLIDAATNTIATGAISHGDSWTNNFLYKYRGDIPIDAKMIDFQLARCATPVLDVSFFIYACTTQDLRLAHYDELMNFYYEELSKQVEAMGTKADKVYSKKTFFEELKKYSFLGLAFSFESTPFIVLDPEDAINMEMEGDEKMNIADVWQIGPFKTKDGRLREANNVVHCVDKGFI